MKNLSEVVKAILDRINKPPGIFKRPVELKKAFQLFKQILQSNNRALAGITDMGEKLSGDYIFDINYIKKSYAALSDNIRNSISHFTQLSRGRYALQEAYDRIDSLIRAMVYGIGHTSGELVISYGDISWGVSRDVGGKNYHLSELRNNLKLNVPDGFALTAHAYEEFIKHNGLEDKINKLGEESTLEEDLKEVRGLIMRGEFPDAMADAIEKALEEVKADCGRDCFLAVRSSAEEEDGDFSFAGQFETILNVPLDGEAVKNAYKQVAASLFSPAAVAYQRHLGYAAGSLGMPVGCVLMVDAVSSGVLYTADPSGANKDSMTISAAWGLGKSVVEGLTEADVYLVKKGSPPELAEAKTGEKDLMVVRGEEGGIDTVTTPEEMRIKQCLGAENVMELAAAAMEIEHYFRTAQDIEWALGKDGKIYILQSRPLRVASGSETEAAVIPAQGAREHPVLIEKRGSVVQRGVAGGKVFVLKKIDELDHFPRGAILVARNDSPQFVRIMPYAAAIITDTGAPVSHMASICREFKIPAVVNTGNATHLLKHGQEITLKADDGSNMAVYDGIVTEMLSAQRKDLKKIEELYEFRKRKYIMRYISPLNLVNPLVEEFKPERCRTMHDILRFMHEKSVQELIEAARHAEGHSALKRLDISIPAGIHVIDIGGGLAPGAGERPGLEQITSLPLRAVVKGMTHPGAWHTEAVSLHVKDFLTSMLRSEDMTTEGTSYTGNNVAVISGEYMNLTLRFGYHFNMIDCYCSERAGNNHIYFRFVGGATDISKRSRRIRLINAVLSEYGFISKTRGDLIISRLSHIGKDEILKILDQAGRLIAFTRQLDAVLDDESKVEKYAKNFIEGNYELQ